jgi:hypothetical protein
VTETHESSTKPSLGDNSHYASTTTDAYASSAHPPQAATQVDVSQYGNQYQDSGNDYGNNGFQDENDDDGYGPIGIKEDG